MSPVVSVNSNGYPTALGALNSIDDSRTPLLLAGDSPVERNDSNGGTVAQAFTNTFRAIVGTGILALPGAVKACGIGNAVILLSLTAILSLFTIRLLILTVTHLRQSTLPSTAPAAAADHATGAPPGSGGGSRELEYTDLGRLALGRPGEALVLTSLMLCQVGSCIAYLIFIAGAVVDIYSVVESNHPDIAPLHRWQVLCILTPVLLILAFLPSPRMLAPTSTAGNIAFVVALVAIFWYGFKRSPPDWSHLEKYSAFDWSGIPVFLGVSIFVLSAHPEAVAIEQSLSLRARKHYPRVLDATFALIVIVYVIFGALCYLFFGEETNSIILINIKAKSYLVALIKSMLVVALVFQFPVTLFPASSALEDQFGLVRPQESSEGCWLSCGSYAIRTLLVVFTVVLAITVPNFQLVTAIVGAFSNGLVSFTLPILFYLQIFKNEITVARRGGLVVVLVFVTGMWIACTANIIATA